MFFHRVLTASALAVGVTTAFLPASQAAAQTVLKAASAFPRGHQFSKPFEQFIAAVDKRSGGSLRIDYKGGAPAVGSPFNLVARLQRRVFDMVGITGAYYDNVVPEGLALALTEVSIQEQRRNGAYDLFNKAHQEKGIYYLGKIMEYVPFQLYLRRPLTKADLNGYRLRIAPHHQPLFTTLGASTIRTDISRIYTYMSNGTVDGFGWPLLGFLPDWYRVTKYRLEPGFYDADNQILLNLAAWRSLSAAHKKLLTDLMIEFEARNKEVYTALNKAAREKQAAAGIKVIKLPPAEAKKWARMATDAGWEAVIKRSPKYGPKLRPLVTRK